MGLSLRYLDPNDMLALSSRWLNDDRAVLEATPALAPLLPRLARAHGALVTTLTSPHANTERLQSIHDASRRIDEQHDHAVRSLYFALSAAIEHLLSQQQPELELVTQLEVLRDLILPEGLATTEATYEEEAASAVNAAEAVAADRRVQHLLKRLHVVSGVSGLDLLGRWSELAQQLGALEFERASLSQSAEAPRSAARARNGWLSIVATMLSIIEHGATGPEAVSVFQEPLERACTQAAARVARGAD